MIVLDRPHRVSSLYDGDVVVVAADTDTDTVVEEEDDNVSACCCWWRWWWSLVECFLSAVAVDIDSCSHSYSHPYR